MAIKNRIILSIIIISSAILLGFINFKQGYKNIVTYMNDYHVVLTKEAVFDRIFVNTDFVKLEYMEGNSVFHFISPFTCYMLAIFWGSFYYLLLNKNYHQFIYSRIKNKQEALKIVRGPYVQNVVLFIVMYVATIYLFIYFNDVLVYQDMLKFIKRSVFLTVSSILLSIGLSSLMFYVYIKWNEIMALLVIFISILFLFIVDLNWKMISIVFIGDDTYFVGGIIIGFVLIFLSHLFLKNVKYEIE
ncbi:hypothetical protein ACFSKI_21885 [Pseudogracilibacillus auburnensis]|uniref:Uncharacterized protein n=1 Tax=Pseudogracilibacillus auburnensis TaxID=1494959 RepID=A0A2V3VX44_9BACI|nr:hypothetical protein [Pseudogracilibacillus auburnensis]MBO1004549.1 hypothetical protein [Pseudogracilibacillus auburnensis]PXW85248.1 hypothetical protein DFR56_11114 [Pseudogracilibacillus auburnensis]